MKFRIYLFYLVIFLSGFTALIYQLAWIKSFSLVFGVHVYSFSAVLTAFMAGLAIGSKLIGKWSDRVGNPLVLLFFAEITLGLLALLFNPSFELCIRIYKLTGGNLYIHPQFIPLIRFLFAFGFLLVPSTVIGGTLPLFIKILTGNLATLGSTSGKAYGINNLGAATGCLMTGFFLVKHIGLSGSLHVGCAMNFLNGFVILLLAYNPSGKTMFRDFILMERNEITVQKTEKKYNRRLINILLLVFTIEGFTTLCYEVIWSRMLTEFSYDKSIYLDTLIIFVFIAGLSIGSLIVSVTSESHWKSVAIIGWLETGIAFFSLTGLFAASRIMPVLAERQLTMTTWWEISGIEYLSFTGFMLIPVILMGITFPVILKIYIPNLSESGKRTGTIGFLDTAGSIFGAFAAGFILIPIMGTIRSFFLMVSVNLLMGIILLFVSGGYLKKQLPVLASVFLLMAFMSVNIPVDGLFKTRIAKRAGEKLLFYKEGAAGTVSVHSFGFGNKALAINGALFAYSTTDDLRSHRLLGCLPYLLHPAPADILVIGFGMGITASSFLQDDVSGMEIAEINPLVTGASFQYFSLYNDSLRKDPRVKFIYDDGMSLMQISMKEYDIVTCDAMHPRLGNYLFTSEFYDLVYKRLKPGGIFCLWMPFNWITETEYKSSLKAFMLHFNQASLWYVNRGVTLLVGIKGENKPDYNRIKSLFGNRSYMVDMAEIDINNPEMLLARIRYGTNDIISYSSSAPVNNNEFSMIEYSREVFQSPNVDVLSWLEKAKPDLTRLINNLPDTGTIGYLRLLSGQEEISNEIKREIDWLSIN